MIPDKQGKQVTLRPFPYPYRAGLSICSDIDGCTKETFIKVHNILNAEKSGLGLPVADSFFGVGREEGQLAYFEKDGTTPTKDAQFLQDAIRTGLVDSIHSWGDFNHSPPGHDFLRPMAERLCEEMDKQGLSIPIWINHGTPHNHQNMIARLAHDYGGDDPESPLYTADLARALGIRYYWDSELVPWPLSEAEGRGGTSLKRRAELWGKNVVKGLILRPGKIRNWNQMSQLAVRNKFRDGSMNYCFSRFNSHPNGLWGLPTRHTLRYTLTSTILNDLEDHQGFFIIYTHLGLPKPKGEPLFPIEDFTALLNLNQRYQQGRIWVTPSSALLNYWRLRRSLEWKVRTKEGRIAISISGSKDENGNIERLAVKDLAGLCFFTPYPERTSISLDDEALSPTAFGKDFNGKECVGFPPAEHLPSYLLDD